MSDASTPYRKDRRSGGTDINPGPYIGVVKDNTDPTKMGNLRVLIPSLSGADTGNSGNLFTCKYLSPFYGVTSPDALSAAGGVYDYESTQHSYGMWMVPPDIDTRVMVIFVEGKKSQGYWFGCIQEPYMNHMIPGLAASRDTETEAGDKKKVYGSDYVPAGEPNRDLFASAGGAAGIDKLLKPIHPFANTLRNQGLSQDTVRGTTTSSARRESPSSVFGISTPGRPNNTDPYKGQLGTSDNIQNVTVVKDAGHTFVMDDGDSNGDNQLIRLRTSSGHQLLMNDTAGVMYLANAKGTVWMEFSNDGAVDIYAQKGYNIRSGGDINFHAEGDINMYANRNIKIKANEHLGQDPTDRTIKGIISIDGSIINQLANRSMNLSVNEGYYSLRTAMGIYTQAAGGQQIHQASGQVHLVGSQVHFNSMPADPNLLQPLKRTGFNQPHGTGTEEVQVPDVTPILRDSVGVMKQDRSIPGMSGMRVPTHEPFLWHYDNFKAFTSEGRIEDRERPGTLGYQEQQNRLSKVRCLGQFQADEEKYLKNTCPNVTDIATLQKASAEFIQNYPQIFNLPDLGPLAIRPLLPGISDVSNQVINRITGAAGGELGNLFKDQIFVNQAGVLYSIGDMGKVINNLPGGNVVGNLAATAQNAVNSTVGNIINNSINSVTRSVADSVFFDRNTSAVKDFFRGDGIDTFAIANDMSASSFVDSQVFGGGIQDIFKNNIESIFGPGAFGNFGISGINLANLSPEGLIQGLGTAAINQGISIVTDQFRNIIAGEITSMTNITSLISGGTELLGSVASSAGDVYSMLQGGFSFSDGADVVSAAFDFGGFGW
jgi:hypothetical protein